MWESLHQLQLSFPHLMGKVLQMGGGNVRHLYCISVFGYKSVCVSAGVCMY